MSEADDVAAITPPPELRRLWAQQAQRMDPYDPVAWQQHVATKAARWGADMELKACCEWFAVEWNDLETADKLRAARRPKPPSLKEQALAQTDAILNDPSRVLLTEVRETLGLNRRALEALDD